jgi:hypothetical protein
LAVTPAELARRLCEAAHPLFGTTGQVVPCAHHISEASRFWGLIQPEGTGSLAVLLGARQDEGLGIPFVVGNLVMKAAPVTATAAAVRESGMTWYSPCGYAMVGLFNGSSPTPTCPNCYSTSWSTVAPQTFGTASPAPA